MHRSTNFPLAMKRNSKLTECLFCFFLKHNVPLMTIRVIAYVPFELKTALPLVYDDMNGTVEV